MRPGTLVRVVIVGEELQLEQFIMSSSPGANEMSRQIEYSTLARISEHGLRAIITLKTNHHSQPKLTEFSASYNYGKPTNFTSKFIGDQNLEAQMTKWLSTGSLSSMFPVQTRANLLFVIDTPAYFHEFASVDLC